MRNISLAYSPDSDDAFMVEAIRSGAIDTEGIKFDLVSADIQTLNERALKGVYDISATSAAVLRLIRDQYELMDVGMSVGDGYGPAVVVNLDSEIADISVWKFRQKGDDPLATIRVAVPGLYTSAYWALRALAAPFTPVPYPFYECSKAVLRGEVEAGVLIHEQQIDYTTLGLKKICDLGIAWRDRYNVPLPLGVNVIRKSLGRELIDQLNRILKQSIIFGLEHRETTLKKILTYQRPYNLTENKADDYISMYVNSRSLQLDRDVGEALGVLLNLPD